MRIARNSILNLVGLGAPLLVAVVTIPVLIDGLGLERFGLLTLIWAVTSYFGLFDLGLGRALTQQLAVALAQERYDDIGPQSATALILMLLLGVLAGTLLAVLAPWGVNLINEVPSRTEAVHATFLMGIGLPAIIMTSGLRGMLEAKHQFGAINLIRLPMGMWTFLGPWLVVIWHGPDLVMITAILVLGRFLAFLAHVGFVWRGYPEVYGKLRWQRRWLRPLLAYGGWLSVSNAIGPIIAYADRFVISVILSTVAVAYYVTPQEIITKLWIVPGAITAVLFPVFSVRLIENTEHVRLIFNKAILWTVVILLPICSVVALFADSALAVWIDEDFASSSAVLLQVFAVGVFINGIATIPLTLIQSAGKARSTAVVHVIELPVYFAALWFMTEHFGLLGAAGAWVARTILDLCVMHWLALRVLRSGIVQQATGWYR